MDNATDNHTLNWQTLSDTTGYSVTYIQLNFDQFVTDETISNDILDRQDGKGGKKMKLTNQQEFNLYQFVTDSTHFSEGECGTFHLNAGFIIHQADQVVGYINVGCGYGQWYFFPGNNQSKGGLVSEKGFRAMEKLLDDINLTNK